MEPFNDNNQDNRTEPGVSPAVPSSQLPTDGQAQSPVTPQSYNNIQPDYQPVVVVTPVQQVANGDLPKKHDKKSKVKLFAIIGSALLVIGSIVFALWVFVFSGMPLKEYDGGAYTVLVPESFEGQESSISNGQITFANPNIPEGDKRSYVEFQYTKYDGKSREELVAQVDEFYFNDGDLYFKDSDTKSNTKIEKITKDNVVLRVITADYMEGDKIVGKANMTMKFTDKGMFTITVVALSDDSGFISSVDKIVDSLKEK